MKYEYNVHLIDNNSWPFDREELLNKWGDMGWELVSTAVEGGVTYFYFKRVKED